MKWYPIIKKIHVWSALAIAMTLSMYAVTGFLVDKGEWFGKKGPNVISDEVISVSIPEDVSNEVVSDWFKKEFEIRAKSHKPKKWGDGTRVFEYSRPGWLYKIELKSDGKSARFELRKEDTHRTIKQFHFVHGYAGGYWFYVFMMDLAALALVLFGVSGIYLWWKYSKTKWLGFVLLISGSLYTIYVVSYFMN